LKTVKLYPPSSPDTAVSVRYCDSFFTRLRGLMFTRSLPPDGGILLVDSRESKSNAAIHMMFMNFDITVLWLDKDGVVVDKALAERWRLMYMPKQPAQYVVELHQDRIDDYAIGERLVWEAV
jgi:uncharacterized membrane protein (UPF0127 family)